MSQPEEQVQAQSTSERKRNPYTLWFVVFSFLAPVVAAYALFFFGDISTFSNKGEILNPVIDVETLKLSRADGLMLTRDEITSHKWHMVYFAGRDCDEACGQVLYNIRQINKAVGKNAYRLRRLMVHLEPAGPELQALIEKEYPALLHLDADPEAVNSALQAVKPSLDKNEIYLVDPLGNIMMRFTQDQPPKDIIHDLNKLFKVSQIG